MSALDLFVLALYLAATLAVGASLSRRHQSVRDYFVCDGRVPWWAIMASIVATETSTVTFISVPGFAFTNNFTFLQLVIGYMIGRLVVAFLFLPAYFGGQLLSVYHLLEQRLSTAVRRLASALFLVTRSLADGFRLYSTGLVLAVVLLSSAAVSDAARAAEAWATPGTAVLVASVLTLGVVTAIYTFLGGMTAVIWTDVVQLAVYLTGAVVATGVLVAEIPGGLSGAVAAGAAAGRFVLFDFSFDVTRSYTFWSGVIGGAFLTTATHGTDQLMVQRYLCASSMSRARLALLASGAVVFAQFALFLFIGALLWAFYAGDPAELARFTVAGRTQSDRIFPTFIVDHLPPGVGGLVCAAVFAAAMSTLSSSLNSSAAAAMSDFYMPLTGGGLADRHYLQRSRLLTLAFACVQVAVALLAIRISTRVVDEVLGIASFTNGLILGVFLLGTFSPGLPQRYALAGMSAGLSTMLVVRLATPVSWQWYVLLGSLVTFLVARAAARAGGWRQDAAAR